MRKMITSNFSAPGGQFLPHRWRTTTWMAYVVYHPPGPTFKRSYLDNKKSTSRTGKGGIGKDLPIAFRLKVGWLKLTMMLRGNQGLKVVRAEVTYYITSPKVHPDKC